MAMKTNTEAMSQSAWVEDAWEPPMPPTDMMSGKSPIIKPLVQTTRKNWLNHVQNQAGQ